MFCIKDKQYENIYELDEEAFEWLDLAEEFFKHDGSFGFGQERNGYVFRAGETYSSIEDEFRQLERLYKACPESVVEPLMPLYQGGEMVGFYMERFDGESLQDYLLNTEDYDVHRQLIAEMEEIIQDFEKEGIVHGDLANNIHYDGEELKVFDPVGVPKDSEAWREMRDFDAGSIDVLKNKTPVFQRVF